MAKNRKTAVAGFKIGDVVEIKNRNEPNIGEIVEFRGEDTAVIKLEWARRPKGGSWEGRLSDTCESCGWPGFLSMGPGNDGKTQIVCMRSGCGHGHGREQRTEIVLLDQLVNISHKEKEEKIKKLTETFKERLEEVIYELDDDLEEGIISKKERRAIIENLKKILK